MLRADEILAGEEFDLVFSWGVLHHTESTERGVEVLSKLVKADGLMYLYLYGSEGVGAGDVAATGLQRFAMNLLPMRARRKVIEWRYGPERAHAVFDLISTPLNDRFTFAEVEAMLAANGFTRALQTMPHREVFALADRGSSSADPSGLPQPERPYWFEREGEPVSAAPP